MGCLLGCQRLAALESVEALEAKVAKLEGDLIYCNRLHALRVQELERDVAIVRRLAYNGGEELSIRLDEMDDRMSAVEFYIGEDGLPEEA